MASKITAATLSVKISELITLDGKNRGSDSTLNVSSINEVDNRIVTIPSGSETQLFSLSNNPGAGTFVTSSLKYARITNRDDTIAIRLRVSASAESTDFRVDAGTSFLLSNSKISGSLVGTRNILSYEDITGIFAEPSGSDVDIELFIAST